MRLKGNLSSVLSQPRGCHISSDKVALGILCRSIISCGLISSLPSLNVMAFCYYDLWFVCLSWTTIKWKYRFTLGCRNLLDILNGVSISKYEPYLLSYKSNTFLLNWEIYPLYERIVLSFTLIDLQLSLSSRRRVFELKN